MKIKIEATANCINSPADCKKVLGKDFSGTGWFWAEAISKNLPSKSLKEAIIIYNTLKDSGLIEMDDHFIWSFKKEESVNLKI